MYVWGRLTKVAATARRRGAYPMRGESRLTFRCLPGDVDQYRHMNNARYNMITDLGRMDIFMRSGIMRLLRTRGWGPMMDGSEIAFIREIRLWRRFQLVTTMDCWTEKHFIARHRFAFEDGQTAALMLGAIGMYDFRNRKFLAIQEVLDVLGHDATPRGIAPAEEVFLASHAGLRAFAKSLS